MLPTRSARATRPRWWGVPPVLAALALALTSVLASPSPVGAQTSSLPPTEIFARVAPSVPVIETENGHGTGFVLDASHVMTAAHVVEDFDQVMVRFPDGATFGTARVVVRDRMVDMAVIEIAGRRDVTASIAAPPSVIGSDLYVLGYPGRTNRSRQPIFSRGLLSQISTWDSANMTYLRTDAAGEPGTSGGPILDGAGNIVGLIQFGSANGAYITAASAADLRDRALRHLRGENVDGIANRKPSGPTGAAFEVQLNGAAHPEESFFVTPAKTGRVEFSLDASKIGGTVAVAVFTDDGDWVAGSNLTPARRSAKLTAGLTAGKRYWISVSAEAPAQLYLQSPIALTNLKDGDDGRATVGSIVGMLDHGSDMDCRPITLRVGQTLTARVESVSAVPMLYIASPGGSVISGNADTENDGGVRGSDAKTAATTASNGDFVVCVGASAPIAHPAGYILTLSATPPPTTAPAPGDFTLSNGALSGPRQANATVALRDGRVMVLDGYDAAGRLLATAEIFDPKTGTVSRVTATDVVARRDPTAGVLKDGRVLVVGGVTAEGVTGVVSIFNPADGTWTGTGSLATPRLGAEVVTLDDGRVLVVTGTGPLLPLATAELYDPATGKFSATGSMSVPRNGLVSTKLADGRVLVAGGIGPDRTVNGTAEVYDPKTGQFTPTGNLLTGRYNHGAVLLPNGQVLIVGGASLTDDLATAELYDPTAGTFRATGSLQFPRQGPTALAVADGRVIVVSGAYRTGVTTQTFVEIGAVEFYDVATGRFTTAGAMQVARQQFGVSLPDGTAVFAGGTTEAGALDSIEVYRPRATGAGGTGFAVPPAFTSTGVALAIFAGGTVDDLEGSAKAVGASGAWVQDWSGRLRLLVIGGPAFLNDQFRQAFPTGLAAATAVTLTR